MKLSVEVSKCLFYYVLHSYLSINQHYMWCILPSVSFWCRTSFNMAWQIGKTKVFLRAGQMAELDARRAQVLGNAARIIQRQSRTYLAQKEFLALRKAVIQLQSCLRGIFKLSWNNAAYVDSQHLVIIYCDRFHWTWIFYFIFYNSIVWGGGIWTLDISVVVHLEVPPYQLSYKALSFKYIYNTLPFFWGHMLPSDF